MHVQKAWVTVLLPLFLGACTGARQAKPDAQALIQADRAFAQATAERRLEGFASFLAGDVMTIRPDSPVIKGRKGLTGRWARLLNDPAMSITWKPLQAVISDSGDMGYTVGSYEVAKTSGRNTTLAGRGKYITIWKKQPDGAWRVIFDSGVKDSVEKR
jgi:ketosteroid isomerase-like protein